MVAGALPPSAPGGHPAAASGSFAAAGPLRLARAAAAGLALALLWAAPLAQAQAQAEAASGPSQVSAVTVTAARSQAKACPPTASGGKPGVECAAARLGEAGKAAQASARQSPAGFTLSARSPDVAVGVVTLPALTEQFGSNLGKSVHPYRPAPPPPAASPFTRRP